MQDRKMLVVFLLNLTLQHVCGWRINDTDMTNERIAPGSVYDISRFENNCELENEYFKCQIQRKEEDVEKEEKREVDSENITSVPVSSTEIHTHRKLKSSVWELQMTESKLCLQYLYIVKNSMLFACNLDDSLISYTINMSLEFVQERQNFMESLNLLKQHMNQENISTIEELTNIFDEKVYKRNIHDVQNIIHALEQFSMIKHFISILKGKYMTIFQEIEQHDRISYYSLQDPIFVEFKQLNNIVLDYYHSAGSIDSFLQQNTLSGIFKTNYSINYLKTWDTFLNRASEIVEIFMVGLERAKMLSEVQLKMEPILISLILIIGMTGNGLLILIFIRHKEMRTMPNLMLINLSVVDCAFIFINLLLNYIRHVSYTWHAGLIACKAYLFASHLFFAASVYSVVMISLQRFLAVTQWQGYGLGKRVESILMISSVWLIGCLTGSLSAIYGVLYYTWCSTDVGYSGLLFAVQGVIVCVIPVVLVAVFTGLTAVHVKKSAQNMPGEATGQEQLKHGRLVTSNVLIAMVVLFIISYVPYHLFDFLCREIGIHVGELEYRYMASITYYMMFLNSCFNPVALFIMSWKYRKYFKKYLFCWRKSSLQNTIPLT